MGVDRVIDITAVQRRTVLALLDQYLPGTITWAYGSRVKWTARPQSDLDLVVFTTPEQYSQVNSLREAFEESNLPFRVDLFVWSEVPERFHQEIERDHVVLSAGNDETFDGRHSGVAKEWVRRRIGALGRVVTGKTPSTAERSNFGGPYPFITIPDLDGRVFIDNTERTLSDNGAAALRTCLLPPGAVLMSCIATVGRCGVTTQPSFTNQQINSVVPGVGLDSRFLYYVFTQLGHELESTGGGGTVYTNVSKSRFSDIEVVVPVELAEQRTIAHIMGTLDDKIELNRRMNETLETMVRALFKSWFVDFDPVRAKAVLKLHATNHSPLDGESAIQGRQPASAPVGKNVLTSNYQVAETDAPPPHQPSPHGSPSATPPQGGSDWTVERARAYLDRMDLKITDLFPDRLVDSELGGIPQGWEGFSLDDLAFHHTQSISPYSHTNEYFAHYSIPAYDSVQMPMIEVGTDIKSNKTLIPDDAVLLSKLNPEIPRVWIPEMMGRYQQICSTEFLAFTPKPPTNRSLLFSLFTETNFRYLLQSMVTGTSKSHQRVRAKDLKQQQVLSGASILFDKFEEIVNPILELVIGNRIENRTMSILREVLLPKLITGELLS